MKNILCFICLGLACSLMAQNTPIGNIAPIGEWQSFANKNNAIDAVEAGFSTFIATDLGLIEIRNQYEQIVHSKVTGLSDAGISRLAYNKKHEVLIIAYSNSNIDLLYKSDNRIVNVPAILQNENITVGRNINDVFTQEDEVFFACDFGLVQFDLENLRFGFTTFTPNNTVYGFTSTPEDYYLSTDLGLYKISKLQGLNYQDFTLWQKQGIAQGLNIDDYTSSAVLYTGEDVYADIADTLMLWNKNTQLWEHIPSEYNNGSTITTLPYCTTAPYPIERLNIHYRKEYIYLLTFNNLYFTYRFSDRELYRQEYLLERAGAISQVASDSFNMEWIAGISQLSQRDYRGIRPYYINSPAYDRTVDVLVDKRGWLWKASSTFDHVTVMFDRSGISRYNRAEWKNFTSDTLSKFLYEKMNQTPFPPNLNLQDENHAPQFRDAIRLAVDPTTGDVFVGSFMDGILHMKGDSVVAIYNQNTAVDGLQPVEGDPSRIRVTGMAFDKDGNCWIANSLALRPIVVRKKDGTWKNFSPLGTLPRLSHVAIDRNGYKWIIKQTGNILVFDEGNMANDGDERFYEISNLPNSKVNSLAADRNGSIWVGTNDGIAIYSCGTSIFTGGCNPSRPILTVDDFNSHLMAGEVVNAIAVDGGNQKWVGTANGVFLLSPDGTEVKQYFNIENSPLPDNNVMAIAVDETTGMVYMATDKGLIGYRGEATRAPSFVEKDNVLVFPNPVPSDYNGMIAIKGLPQDAYVKITDITGKLVHETRAFGGQAVWDGYDYTGRKTASGVYLVFAVTSDGAQKLATKIAFIK